ncbi:hypothetical protein ATO6_05635 [Oceanicola sp. 22II-s10i]|uniref:hypothetical protein n=1 Tax=Oceanicola sp. 22II-s10i TaxID=1317116 RepID=UPI000B52615D|nr:hypothetical protein [Oceanicola sp. 22II-s10i]OWU86309.1 hypothetical protein ATO6_05635 [Oceanicola sp. 22II-s10i]
MTFFDPAVNNERLEKALAAVMVSEIVEFTSSGSTRHVVVFDDPIDPDYVGSRVRFYQSAVFSLVGSYPEIEKAVPSCLKIFFSLPPLSKENSERMKQFFVGSEFKKLCEEVSIVYVQFGGAIFRPN